MITEYIRYQLTSTAPDSLVSAYEEAAAHLRAAPECHGYALLKCQEEPTAFILRIHWASTAAHMEGFRRGPNFPPFLALIKPFISEIAEMRHYDETAVTWARTLDTN